jgi:thioredoxin reductase (NADPH)
MMNMREQSLKNGVRIQTKTIASVDMSKNPFILITEDGVTIEAKSIIIATGATAKRLGAPGEERLRQKGISACAICDGGLPMFRNKPIVVVGG